LGIEDNGLKPIARTPSPRGRRAGVRALNPEAPVRARGIAPHAVTAALLYDVREDLLDVA